MGKVLELRCALTLCDRPRAVKHHSRLCQEHLIIECVKLLQARGNYYVGTLDVILAMEGVRGESASAIRKVLRALTKYEDKIIQKLNN